MVSKELITMSLSYLCMKKLTNMFPIVIWQNIGHLNTPLKE